MHTLLPLLFACRPPIETPTTVDTASPTPTPPIQTGGVAPSEDLAGLADLTCAQFEGCAPPEEEWLGDTCCAYGDPLTLEHFGDHIEAVDVAVDDTYIVSCSGFGAAFAPHGGDFADFDLRNLGIGRCQRMAIGPDVPGGRMVYLAHHGDGWVPEPALWAYRIQDDGNFEQLAQLEEGFLYEGLAATDTHLYVASHDTGLQIYSFDEDALPVHVGSASAFVNAIDLRIVGDRLYVLDSESVRVMSIANPDQPVVVGNVELQATGRDLDVVGDRMYVALGSRGLEVFDLTDPIAPVSVDRIVMDGSVQSVKANAERIALANWSHVAVMDPTTLRVVATEKTVSVFEQDLGVAIYEDYIVAAEWSGIYALRHRDGYVAPDVWLDADLFTFQEDVPSETEVYVTNRGPLWLNVPQIALTEGFSVDTEGFELAPGETFRFDLAYAPPAGNGQLWMDLFTNDPDPNDNPRRVRLSAGESGQLAVGDSITEAFAFLDPSGNNDLAALEGQVVVLAYFALF